MYITIIDTNLRHRENHKYSSIIIIIIIIIISL